MVFRIFLNKKNYQEKNGSENHFSDNKIKKDFKSEKRGDVRFNIYHQKLKVAKEEDFFIVKEISRSGLSGNVSDRIFRQIKVKEIFDAKLFFRSIHQKISLRVTWKNQGKIGFQFESDQRNIDTFLKNILIPVEIGHSLKVVKAEFLQSRENIRWYHGDFDSNLYIEFDGLEKMVRWNFYDSECYLEWHPMSGIKTGKKKNRTGNFLGENWQIGSLSEEVILDEFVDIVKVQYIFDILKVFNSPFKKDLLETVEEGYGV